MRVAVEMRGERDWRWFVRERWTWREVVRRRERRDARIQLGSLLRRLLLPLVPPFHSPALFHRSLVLVLTARQLRIVIQLRTEMVLLLDTQRVSGMEPRRIGRGLQVSVCMWV